MRPARYDEPGAGRRRCAPRREARIKPPSTPATGSMSAAKKVAVLKGGGSLERTVSLRSGARSQNALERLGHEVVAIDAGPELVAQLHECEPDAAFVALHGRDGEDGTVQGLLESDRRSLHRLGAGGMHALHRQGAGEVPDARGGHPDTRLHARSRRARSRSWGWRRRSGTSSAGSVSRWSSSRQARAQRWV